MEGYKYYKVWGCELNSCDSGCGQPREAFNLSVTEERYWAPFYMPLYTSLHNLLNELVQIANTIELQIKKDTAKRLALLNTIMGNQSSWEGGEYVDEPYHLLWRVPMKERRSSEIATYTKRRKAM
jgi:hypothetical protein